MRRDSRRGPPRPLDERGLERAAHHYVKRFPTTVANLERVLTRRIDRDARLQGEQSEQMRASLERCRERVIKQLVAAGLVDDSAFARGLATSLKRRGLPKFRIRQKLRDKGVGETDRDAALALLDEEDEDPDHVAAWHLARRRRLGPFRLDDEARQARREKDLGVMARAGFPYGLAKQVIDGDLDDAPDGTR